MSPTDFKYLLAPNFAKKDTTFSSRKSGSNDAISGNRRIICNNIAESTHKTKIRLRIINEQSLKDFEAKLKIEIRKSVYVNEDMSSMVNSMLS